MNALKPCPFCGENVTLDYRVMPNRKHWFITCDCCGMMYQDTLSQRKYVKDGWNNRPIEDALNARILDLVSANMVMASGIPRLQALAERAKQMIRNNDKDAEIERLNATIDRTVNAWESRCIEKYDEIKRLNSVIDELEEKQRWIPVSERLPDNWESVLTIDISKSTRDMVTAFYDPETSLWSTHLPNYDLWVTHWMPLPEPPIVYGKVCEE